MLIGRPGDVGLRARADDEDEERQRRARSTLKLDSLDKGGNGDELFRL